MPASGVREFPVPGKNGGGSNDLVLRLDGRQPPVTGFTGGTRLIGLARD